MRVISIICLLTRRICGLEISLAFILVYITIIKKYYVVEVNAVEAAEKVYALMKERNGYLTTKEANENGLTNKTMQRMTDRAAQGLYVAVDVFPDPYSRRFTYNGKSK